MIKKRSESTWEPEENLEYCADLVIEFEAKLKESESTKNISKPSLVNQNPMQRGFDRGLTPEKILGIMNIFLTVIHGFVLVPKVII